MLRLRTRTGLETIGVEGLIVDETETQVVWRAYKIARADPYLQVICGVQSADNRHESLLIEIVRGYRSGQRDPDALAHDVVQALTASARQQLPFVLAGHPSTS